MGKNRPIPAEAFAVSRAELEAIGKRQKFRSRKHHDCSGKAVSHKHAPKVAR